MHALATDLFFVETARRVDGDALKLESMFCRAEDMARALDDSVLAAYVQVQASEAAALARAHQFWVADAIGHWSQQHDELASVQDGITDCIREADTAWHAIDTAHILWMDLNSAAFRERTRASRSRATRNPRVGVVNREAMDAAAPLLTRLVDLSAATRGDRSSLWTRLGDALRAVESSLQALVPADYPTTPRPAAEGPLDPDEALLVDPDESTAIAKAESVRRDSLALAREWRDDLLRTVPMYGAADVEQLVRGEVTDSNPSQYAARLRRERRLLGVRHGGRYSHPVFQFAAATRQVRPEMRALLAALPATDDGWTAMLWCYRPNGKLAGQRPADVFAADALAVIDAARREFVKERARE